MSVPFQHVSPRKSRYFSRLSASLSLAHALALALLCASGVAQAGDFTTKDGCYQVSFSQMTQTGSGATLYKALVISGCQTCVESGKLFRYTSEGRGTDQGTCLEKPPAPPPPPPPPPNPYAGIVAIPAGTTDLAKFIGESCYLWGVFVNTETQCKIQGDCATKGHIVSTQQVVGSPILVGSALTSNSPDTFGRYIALINGTRKVWVKVGARMPNNCLVDMGGASDGPLNVGDKVPPSLLTSGKSYYLTAKHSGKPVAVAVASLSNGAAIVQWTNEGADHFKWTAEDAGEGYYYLLSKKSGLALSVVGGSMDNDAKIIQWPNERTDHFKWKLEDAGGGYYYVLSKKSGKALHIPGQNTSDGAQATQWPKSDGGNHLKFMFTAATPDIPIVAGKEYKLTYKLSGKVLDVLKDSTVAGAAVSQWVWGGGENQKWVLQDAGGGYFYLVNKSSKLVLDVLGASQADGAAVSQWSNGGGENQKWMLEPTSDGYYLLINKNSGKALHIEGSSVEPGAKLVQWTKANADHFKWKIEYASP